jgi:hypothetical protein
MMSLQIISTALAKPELGDDLAHEGFLTHGGDELTIVAAYVLIGSHEVAVKEDDRGAAPSVVIVQSAM